MTRFQHHDMVVFVFLHTFSMCKYMCSPSLWQKLPHLVRVDQNIRELGIWKPLTSGLQGLYPLRLCHHCHRSYWASGFYRQQKRGWSLPGWTSVEEGRELLNFTKVFFTLNNCEQLIPLMFLLLKNWRISLRWLRYFGCLFLLKLLFLFFLLILRYEVSVLPRT